MVIIDNNTKDDVAYGKLNENMSVNKALGFDTTTQLFSSLENIENDLKQKNSQNTSYKDTDNKTGTVSAYAVQDFFTRTVSAYGIATDKIGYNNIVNNVALLDGEKNQLTLEEFKVATERLEEEIRLKIGKNIDVFNFTDTKK